MLDEAGIHTKVMLEQDILPQTACFRTILDLIGDNPCSRM